MQLAHIAYFLIPSYTSTAIASVKQCLFYDPDSRPCAKVHKLLRKLDKETTKARNYIEGGEWRRALAVLQGDGGLIAQLDDALESATAGATPLIPKQFNARKKSPARLELYALACKASIQLGEMSKTKGAKWCEAVFEMDPEHVDGLTGRGERLMKDEAWEEAVRVFEKAFANGGQSSQEALNRLQKAQRLLKQSKAKDYYKVRS
jgi:DnaJ family protein C protein 3